MTRESESTIRWTCPMHPEVVRDEPGDCPQCGMHLERSGGASGHGHSGHGHSGHGHATRENDVSNLDRVPDHAAVDTSVELAKRFGHRGSASLVNAVLRRAPRDLGANAGVSNMRSAGLFATVAACAITAAAHADAFDTYGRSYRAFATPPE